MARLDWHRASRGSFLDACAGTYDLSIELAAQRGFGGTVVALDFAKPMLDQGRAKIDGLSVVPVCGDSLKLPFADDAFGGAMVAFGVRNLCDLDYGLRELLRTLEPGAKLVVLDFALPRVPLLRGLYMFYFTRVLPLVGRIISGHRWAYAYLPESVREFPEPEELAERMAGAGFSEVQWDALTGGIATIHVGRKSDSRR